MHAFTARLRPLIFATTAAVGVLAFMGAGPAGATVVEENLTFAAGTDHAFQYGHVEPGDVHVYRVQARRGQVMIAEADPYRNGFVVTVDGPTGTLVSDQQWSKITLPRDGSYRLSVRSTGKIPNAKDYSISVTID